MPTPTRKQLEARIAHLETLLLDMRLRFTMLAGWFEEATDQTVLGVRTIRGNDGVRLETVRLETVDFKLKEKDRTRTRTKRGTHHGSIGGKR